jgi:hypothetical protein
MSEMAGNVLWQSIIDLGCSHREEMCRRAIKRRRSTPIREGWNGRAPSPSATVRKIRIR